MSSKSKKNRRSISQTRKETGNFAVNTSTISGIQTSQPREVAEEVSPKRAAFNSAYEVANDMSFIKDLKWIGVVTAIVVILLIIAYYVFR